MIVTLISLILLVYFHDQCSKTNTIDTGLENKYIKIFYFLLIILSALRCITDGTDISGYVGDYDRISNYSFAEISEKWPSYKFYFWLSKVFSYTQLPYHYWLGFVNLVFLISFTRLLNRFSNDKLLAIFIFYTCGCYGFAQHGLKQAVAMALMWNAFVELYDKKYWKTLLYFYLAYITHKSALIFGFAFVLWFIRNRKDLYYFVTAICIVIASLTSSILTYLTDILEDEHYSSYLGEETRYNYTTFIFYLGLLCVAFSTRNKSEENSNTKYTTAIAAISTFSQLFALVVASAFRLGLYFTPFLCIMCSNNLKNDKTIRTVVIIVSAIFMLYSGRNFPYKFFWQ